MKKLVLIISFLTLPLAGQAQEAFYVSGMLGMTMVDTSDGLDLETELSYGARAGLLFNDHISAGLYLHRYSGEDTTTNIGNPTEVDFTNVMAELTYYFSEADENSFWISGLLGITNIDTNCTGNGCTQGSGQTSYGVAAGYHFMVAPNWSISPQITSIVFDADPNDISEISGMVNVTLWL